MADKSDTEKGVYLTFVPPRELVEVVRGIWSPSGGGGRGQLVRLLDQVCTGDLAPEVPAEV